MEIVKILDTWGFCYIHLDHGCYEVWNKAIPSAYDEPGSQLFIAEIMRKEGITTPFLVQGKLNYGPLVEQADMSPNMKLGLKARLNSAHIQIHTYAKMVDIEPREVLVETSQGIIPITCDNVVLASGFKANHALADALANKPYPVFPIGDCVKPGKVYDAVHGGFHALRKLG